MYIENTEELIEALKLRLRDYLRLKIGDAAEKNDLCCYVHKEDTPSMKFNPKTGDTTVHCFGCGVTHDIFAAAAHFEGLPASGPEWIKTTLPSLAEQLQLQVKLGQVSAEDRMRARLYKFASDLSNIIEESDASKYIRERRWSNKHLTIGRISIEEAVSKLMDLGYTKSEIDTSRLVQSKNNRYIGEDMVTFVIKDFRGRPIGLVSRNLTDQGPKYINTPETSIYSKRKTLLGLNSALRHAKRDGLYIVEGPGDIAALNGIGVNNVAAICGTAFTAEHLELLKTLGVKKLFFALDWDEAGTEAIERILTKELRLAPGISCYVVNKPGEFLDPGEFCESIPVETEQMASSAQWRNIPMTNAFNWVLARASETKSPEELCAEIVPIIASEQSAVRRELLCSALSKQTGFSNEAIDNDVRVIREGKNTEHEERLKASAAAYARGIKEAPENAAELMAQHESEVEHIGKEFSKEQIGRRSQLNKYQALQEKRAIAAESGGFGEFKLKYYTFFGDTISGGANSVDGVLTYVGGRENSGKTTVVIGIGIDIALHDEDAIVLYHFTDDSFAQAEPRMKANIAMMIKEPEEPKLTIGMAVDPTRCPTDEHRVLYERADSIFMKLLSEEKLICIDMGDGSNMSVVERQLRYIRRRYPEKKLLVIQDGTHDVTSFMELDQNGRMRNISNMQKRLAAKYHCHYMATVEYRKFQQGDSKKMKLPINDDIADARTLKYRANLIIHVYNDLNDRRDDAEVFWRDPDKSEERQPRLMLVYGKNKITAFKDKLLMDLDKEVVGIHQVSVNQGRLESTEEYEKKYGNKGSTVEADDWD